MQQGGCPGTLRNQLKFAIFSRMCSPSTPALPWSAGLLSHIQNIEIRARPVHAYIGNPGGMPSMLNCGGCEVQHAVFR